MIDITWNGSGLEHNNINLPVEVIKAPKIEEIDTKLFDGKSQKFLFTDTFGDRWICKFDKSPGKNKTYDCLSEHISCTILRFNRYRYSNNCIWNYK